MEQIVKCKLERANLGEEEEKVIILCRLVLRSCLQRHDVNIKRERERERERNVSAKVKID